MSSQWENEIQSEQPYPINYGMYKQISDINKKMMPVRQKE